MSLPLTFVSEIPLLIWIYLLKGRGDFWRVSRLLSRLAPSLSGKRIIAIIPARNEAAIIGQAVTSLLKQNVEVIVVDDDSSDGTTEAARVAEDNLTILPGQPLPPGWTGKLWALSQGVAHADTLAPDYLLFTDADIRHGPNSVAELVSIAESRVFDLASYMVKLTCATPAEKALIPAFVFFFLTLYPPRWIAFERSKTAAAAGGCILIRPEALRKIGGLAAIRSEIIDDCALARAVKRSGGRIWMGLTASTRSIRSYGSFAEIGRMISRTAFSQLRHSPLVLVATLLALFITYLLPPILLFSDQRLMIQFGIAAWLLMSICYLPMVRFYRLSPLWALSLPLVAAFYAGATIHSAIRYWTGLGGEWKGRVQDMRGD
ncbi:MAG: glycosyltransferase [Bryobacteraceae bacterium]